MQPVVERVAPVLLTLMLSLAAAACADGGDGPQGRWVGALEGTDAVIAVVSDGSGLLAYVCGGDATRDTHTRWYSGGVASDGFAVTASDWTLEGDVDASGDLVGTVTSPDGQASPFHARGAVEGTLAGLYIEQASPCSTGLIITQPTPDVLPSAQGAWCMEGGSIGQVVPIMPLAFEGSGVAAELVGLSEDAQRHLGVVLPTEGLLGL